MKVYTKKGDKGQTSLIGGTRVVKHHARIEAYGTIDELNSFIGLIRDQEIDNSTKEFLIEIQDRLFTLGSLLAQDPEKAKMKLPKIKEEDITKLEQQIDQMDLELPEMRSFVLPGGHTTVSFCHISRCVCRKAERRVSYLMEIDKTDEIILRYLNRLSDYLFTLSRKISHVLKVEEVKWIPKSE